MQINFKDIIQITIITVVLSFIRYLFLDEYPLLKTTKLAEASQISDDNNNLLMFVENLESPTLIDIKTAKLLYDNQLATFIDARDSDSFKNQHIFSSINIPYDLIEQIESDYDLNYLIELNENFIINVKLDDYSFFIGLDDGDFYISKNIENIDNKSYANKNFIIYCSGHGCSLSEDLGFYLYNLGVKNILIYEGGIPEWIDNKYPVSNE